MRHKLSNVLLVTDEHTADYQELYFRNKDGQGVSFLTFFGALSIAKWKKYTSIEKYFLHIEVKKPASLKFETENGPLGEVFEIDGLEELEVPDSDLQLVSFSIDCSVDNVVEAYYFAEVDFVNTVDIAIATTTFKKEEYIEKNIQLVKDQLINSSDEASGHFAMFVIDNGRTLDAEKLSGNNVSVFANPNVGGAGGFARGMMEALANERNFTHVLLMDDDVRVSPESFKRTYNLLALANENYKGAFINGAMLSAQEPNFLFEDVAHVIPTGAYRALKKITDVLDIESLEKNESINVEVSNAYGAWWYSCIPVSAIKQNGLPLPVFVRCDDVEFGIRNKPVYMTMNGICVWHDAFEGRWRPSVDCYQYTRNFLIMNACHDCCSEALFMQRLKRNVRLRLRVMDYSSVELMLDGFEDYLKGPDFIKNCSGECLMKENGAKNEKFYALEDLDQSVVGGLKYNNRLLGKSPILQPVMQLVRSLPYDRHWLPDGLLRKKPEAIYYSGLSIFAPRTFATRTLVALQLDGEHASIRELDKERYRKIQDRLKELEADYTKRGEEVRDSYKAALPEMTSWDFWNNYLGTDLKPVEQF